MTILEAKSKVTIMKDNAGCLALVNGSRIPARTKHIAVRIGFIRDLTKSNVIQVKAYPVNMLADPLTKPLGSVDLKRQVEAFMETVNTTNADDDSDLDKPLSKKDDIASEVADIADETETTSLMVMNVKTQPPKTWSR
jgi:hypothetical protein